MSDINIGVGVTYEDIGKNAKLIRAEIEDIFKQTEGKPTTVAFDRLADSLGRVYEHMDQIIGRAVELENMKIMPEGYEEAVSSLKAAQAEYAETINKSRELAKAVEDAEQKLASSKTDYRSGAYESWRQEIANLAESYAQTEEKVNQLTSSLKQAEINVKRFTTSGNDSAKQKWSGIASGLRDELSKANSELVQFEKDAQAPLYKMQDAFAVSQEQEDDDGADKCHRQRDI